MRFERLARSLGAFVVLFLLAGGSSDAHAHPPHARTSAPGVTSADGQIDAPIERRYRRDIRTHVLSGFAEY